MSDAMIRHGFGEIGSRYYTHADTEALRYDCTPCLRSQNQALKDQIEETRLNFDGNLTAMGHPPHPNCKFRRLLQGADQ